MSRVGIVGGGQLARMLALAGVPLDIRCTVLDPSPDACATQVTSSIVGAYDDPTALATLAGVSDVVTYEFENVPVVAVRSLERTIRVAPSPDALETSQDRLAEKALFERVGLPTAAFAQVDSLDDLVIALQRIGTPAVLKTRRLGYDGNGQAIVNDPVLAEDAWRSVGEVPSILEGLVDFDREVSIVAVRGEDGDTRVYPLSHNEHRGGILRVTRAPASGVEPATREAAERLVGSVMADLGYIGVIAIELFQVGERLLGNELAPRVHNSAHWTIEGAETSQFENHLRAVTRLPLGSTEALGHSAMVNLIGSIPDPASVAAIPGAHLHLYGKQPRPRRKLGHVTVRADDEPMLERALLQVEGLVDDANHE